MIITTFYVIMSICSVASYIKMIRKMIEKSDQSDSSILSWFIWWLSSVSGVLYSGFVVNDMMFLFTSLGHLLGTSIILVLQFRKQGYSFYWKE